MLNTTSEETYKDGEIIFDEGSTGDWVYVVESGAVELYKVVDGKKVVIEVLRAGEVFGELAFIARFPRTASARALGDTVLGVMDKMYMDTEYNRLSGSFQLVLKSLAMRLKKTTEAAVGKKSNRHEPRLNKSLALTFKDKDAFVQTYTQNLSGSGLFIKTAKPLPKGEALDLQVKIPNLESPMKFLCVVAWSRKETSDPVNLPVGMGVKFVQMSDGEKDRLRKILASI
ncbi:MAG: TIGR02266 family protein [Desulfatibacillum sp.]|nr:TIGR02266 family protein [Desulfatibacillum sp.]